MIGALLSGGAGLLSALSWKTYGLLLALAAGAGLWVWIALLRADLADLRGERDQLKHHLTVQKALLIERDRAIETYVAAERRASARREAAARAREEAIHAPETEDAPLAPVLRRALERLR